MRSRVADELRAELREEVLKLPLPERIALALRLGEEELANFAVAQHIDLEEARRIAKQRARVGRRYSRCMEELDQ